MKYDYLIIGNGIAGVTAAETIREKDPKARVGIVGDEEHLIYSRVLLPSYLKKKIDREKLFLRTFEDFEKKDIDLMLSQEVRFVDVKRKEIGLSNRKIIGFRKLLIASGGRVSPWGVARDQDFIYRLQTLDDADKLYRVLDTIKRPLVVGSSFIALEFLEIFVVNQSIPTLISTGSYFFPNFLDHRGADLLEDNFLKHGVKSIYKDSVASMALKAGFLEVDTKGLRRVEADALAVGIGLERNTTFLQGSGVELGEIGVRTNEFLETNQEGIFSAGDMAEFYDVILGRHRVVGNWMSAFLQGKRAGLNMVGDRDKFMRVSAYSITNLGFQITAVGECNSGIESIVRCNPDTQKYERFFMRSGVLVGAVLINCFPDKTHIALLIEKKVNTGPYKNSLSDFSFDIHAIEP